MIARIKRGVAKRWRRFWDATLLYITNHVIARCLCSRCRMFWYRHVMGFEIGKRSFILTGCRFARRGNLRIGDGTIVNNDCRIDNREPIRIGDRVSISLETLILTGGHDMDSNQFAYQGRGVIIEDYTWVCARAIIQPGVTLGRGCVVLTGSVVAGDVAPMQVVGGVPARFVRERKADLSYELIPNPPAVPPMG